MREAKLIPSGTWKIRDESPNEHMSPLLQDTIPKCEHNPKMFGPDVETVKRSDLSLSPEEAGDSLVPLSSREFKELLFWKENEVEYDGIHGKDWKGHESLCIDLG